MFKHLVGQSVVIRRNGTYKTCDLYEFRGGLFAKNGSGFVRLNSNGSSSVDGLSIDLLAYDGPLFGDKFGKLCVESGPGFVALEVDTGTAIRALPSSGEGDTQ